MTKRKEGKEIANQSNIKLQKNNPYTLKGNIDLRKGIVKFILAAGTIILFVPILGHFKDLNQSKKEINNTNFEQNLDNLSSYSCLDELLEMKSTNDDSYDIENYITVLEEQLNASEIINDINLKKYDLAEDIIGNKSDAEIDEIAKSITPEEIILDIQQFKETSKKVENNEIDLNVPTKETIAFLELVTKLKNIDSIACNTFIANSYSKVEELYYDVITAQYIDECGLDVEDSENITYSCTPNADDLKNYYLQDNRTVKSFEFKLSNNISNIVNELGYNAGKEITPTQASQYNRDRNKLINDAINKIKQMSYYNLNIKKHEIKGKLSVKKYQKINKQNH